ncbi:MAG: molecular chaperone DnaJ [Candidatus Dormibacteraceae bacterium]
MRLVYRPLPLIWPSGPRTSTWSRRPSPFKSSWSQTINLLERELRQLGVRSETTVVLEAGFSESEIRLDGLPRANARPGDPAVIVSFESKFGPLRYGCDSYTFYEANLRAIARALEALRAVDRYGVTKRGEQYKGWLALPAEGETGAWAREFIMQTAGIDGTRIEIAAAYRMAAKKLHPAAGGNREEWDRLQRAKVTVGL